MIRGRAGLLEGADEGTTRTSVTSMLETHVPDPDERAWIEPAVLALLGIDDGSGSEQRFAAWRTFFERLAATAPVVLVFEDFHFADSGLLDFVDHLLEWSRGVPIYVVTLARPELLDRRPDWGAAKRNFTSLYLEPLPEPAMRELLDGLVPGLPEPAVRAIVTRADGVPLYAVETVRMLLAEGSLTVEGGRYRPTGDLTSMAVPETLTALIASRLDSLTSEDRALVSDAAVLGQSFTLAGLASVSGIPEAQLEVRLRPLVRREFLTLEFDARSPERGQCAFVQALIREVAYNTLARRDRKIRHLAAARYFEALGSEELAGALAGHYLAAYQNAGEGAEADALAAQARIALRAAAERAINLGSLGQAVGFLDQARAVTRDPADVAEVLERAGWAANNGSLNDLAEDRLRQAVELRRSLPDRDALAGAIATLGDLLISVLRREVALALLEPAVDELVGQGREPTGPGGVALLAQLCRAYFMLDRQREAIAVADRALEAAERLDLAPIVADVLITRGSSLAKLGRIYEGGGAIRAAIELADERGLISTALRGRLNLSVTAGDPRAQLEASQDALQLARRYGLRGFVRVLIGNLASAALETGDWKLAAAELQAGLDESDDPLDANYLAWAATTFAAWRGEDVRAQLTRLSAWAESFDEASARAAVFDLRGASELGAGRFSTACDAWLAYAPSDQLNAANAYFYAGVAALLANDLERLRSAISGLDAIPGRARLSRVDRRLLEAGRECLQGHRSEALREGRAALVDYGRLGLRWRQSLGALVLLATIGPGDPEVRAAADAARPVFEELGARPFLEMLDERLGAPLAPESDQVGARTGPRIPVDASIDTP